MSGICISDMILQYCTRLAWANQQTGHLNNTNISAATGLSNKTMKANDVVLLHSKVVCSVSNVKQPLMQMEILLI